MNAEQILTELSEIKRMLALVVEGRAEGEQKSEKEYLTPEEAAELLGAKRSYVYYLTHQKLIPYSKPGGNKVLIKRSDLLEWVQSGRIKSSEEVQEAAALIARTQRRRRS